MAWSDGMFVLMRVMASSVTNGTRRLQRLVAAGAALACPSRRLRRPVPPTHDRVCRTPGYVPPGRVPCPLLVPHRTRKNHGRRCPSVPPRARGQASQPLALRMVSPVRLRRVRAPLLTPTLRSDPPDDLSLSRRPYPPELADRALTAGPPGKHIPTDRPIRDGSLAVGMSTFSGLAL